MDNLEFFIVFLGKKYTCEFEERKKIVWGYYQLTRFDFFPQDVILNEVSQEDEIKLKVN